MGGSNENNSSRSVNITVCWTVNRSAAAAAALLFHEKGCLPKFADDIALINFDGGITDLRCLSAECFV
jgi:rhodanese-related sulfurtransferase